MSESRGGQNSSWKHRLRRLAEELSHTLALRRELATLEVVHDRQLLLRGILVGGIGVVMALTGLPLLLQTAASGLAAVTSLTATVWTVIIGTALLVPGLLLLVWAIRKTRSGFCGLRGTLAELNEDLIWLREWVESDENLADTTAEAHDER